MLLRFASQNVLLSYLFSLLNRALPALWGQSHKFIPKNEINSPLEYLCPILPYFGSLFMLFLAAIFPKEP
jgi:hypothetical protein